MASVSYDFTHRFSVYASFIITMNRTSEDYSGELPWVCEPCGLGYIRPKITSSRMEIGRWRSSMVMAGLEVLLRESEPQLLIRAGYGLQRIASPAVLVEETGTQVVLANDPPYVTMGMKRSFIQEAASSKSGVYGLGLEIRHRHSRRVHISFNVDLLLGEVNFTGEQVYLYSGATQSDPEADFGSHYTFSQRTGTTRLLARIGLSIA